MAQINRSLPSRICAVVIARTPTSSATCCLTSSSVRWAGVTDPTRPSPAASPSYDEPARVEVVLKDSDIIIGSGAS